MFVFEDQCYGKLLSKEVKGSEADEKLVAISLFEIKIKLPFALRNYRRKPARKSILWTKRNSSFSLSFPFISLGLYKGQVKIPLEPTPPQP